MIDVGMRVTVFQPFRCLAQHQIPNFIAVFGRLIRFKQNPFAPLCRMGPLFAWVSVIYSVRLPVLDAVCYHPFESPAELAEWPANG
jgi:hypothetical protein